MGSPGTVMREDVEEASPSPVAALFWSPSTTATLTWNSPGGRSDLSMTYSVSSTL